MQRSLISTGRGFRLLEDSPVTAEGLRWVDLESPTEEEFQLLEHGFKFHPLAVEDCRHLDQRSKVEEYDDHLFVVLHVYTHAPQDPSALILHELHAFLRKGLLVTVHDEPVDAVNHVWTRALKGDASGCLGPAALYHNVADAMVDQMVPVVEALDDRVDSITEMLFGKPSTKHLEEILKAKRAVGELRRLTGGAREVLGLLARGQYPIVSVQEAVYFRNVLDHLHNISQQVDLARDHVTDARDLHLNAQSYRTNEIVKRLSILATLGLPLTVITGFFGMNFTMLPFDNPEVMVAALGGMVVLPSTFVLFLWWRSWF